jgi:alkaline phosphatase D
MLLACQVALDPSRDYTANVVLTGLVPHTQYTFYASLYDSQGKEQAAWPARFFNTSPPAGTRGPLKFSFGSCVMRQFPEFWTPIEGFRKIAARKPDLFLLIGDQIYGDLPIPAPLSDYPAKWRDSIADPAYQELANAVPIFHMYDDHEVVDNWVRCIRFHFRFKHF